MNNVYYFEIQADEPDRAMKFYQTVFGWQFAEMPDTVVKYWTLEGAGIPGGLLKRPGERPGEGLGTNAFTCSVQVEDFDATARLIIDHGGRVALPKFAVPGKCWQGYFLDTEGNVLGLFQPDTKAG